MRRTKIKSGPNIAKSFPGLQRRPQIAPKSQNESNKSSSTFEKDDQNSKNENLSSNPIETEDSSLDLSPVPFLQNTSSLQKNQNKNTNIESNSENDDDQSANHDKKNDLLSDTLIITHSTENTPSSIEKVLFSLFYSLTLKRQAQFVILLH